jgi:phosphohistidine swiveling domain-containing protein
VTAARSALAARPAAERDRFEGALARAERVYPVREGNGFFTVSVPVALLRYAVFEIGARLATRGLVSRRDDVFFLELGDARAALAGAGDRRSLVARRKGERAWTEQDVLVCPITSPIWSVLFSSVGALVTDTGGHLAHAAIIAREYGIPGVLATGNATELLRDGQLVTVDGSAGIVALYP